MFKNLFGKKIEKENNDKEETSKSLKLSLELKLLVEKSPLQIMTHQLFMHYQTENLKEELNNPLWQNQAVFFWSSDESFERKSLPAEFKNYPQHYFIFNGLPPDYSLNSGETIPWFGMPGGGMKYFVTNQNSQVTISDLIQKQIIRRVNKINLTESNSNVLQNRGEYYFIMDEKKAQFQGGKFICNGKQVEFSDLYEYGILTLIQLLK